MRRKCDSHRGENTPGEVTCRCSYEKKKIFYEKSDVAHFFIPIRRFMRENVRVKKKSYHDGVVSLRCHTFGSDETHKFHHQFPEVVTDDRMPAISEIMIEIISDAEVSQ